MSKLFTEQELRKEVANWFKPYKVSQIFLNNIVKIIHTQKRLYAKDQFKTKFEELLLSQEMYDLTHILSIVLYLRLFQNTNAKEATMTVDSLNREGVDLGKLTLKATFEPKHSED